MKTTLLNSFSFRLISLISLVYFTQACGGGSGGTAPPIEPITYNFSLSSKLTNSCGVEVPFNDIELLLQDINWQTINRYSPDENGLISFETTDQSINYTLVAKNQVGEGVAGFNIVSFYQAKTTTPAIYKPQNDNLMDQSNCECITQDLNLTHRSFASRSQVSSSLNFTSWQANGNGSTLFKGVESCRVADGSWPLESFSVMGTDVNNNVIGVAAFSENFDATMGAIWDLAAFDVAQSVSLTQGHQAFETSQLIRDNKHFTLSINANDTKLMLFNSHDYIAEVLYQSNAKVVFQETSSIFGTTNIHSNHQILSNSYSNSFAVAAATTKPNIDDINFSEIKADGSYDYSAVSNHPMAIISFNYSIFNTQTQEFMPVNWTTYGPIEGQLPIKIPLTGYENIINSNSSWHKLNVQLMRSGSSNNYDSYVRYYQNLGDQNFNNNLKSYFISIAK